MRANWILWVLSIVCFPALAFGKLTEPTSDLPGSKDSPLLKRFQGSLIISYEQKNYQQFRLPLAPLERVEGQKDGRNNKLFEPKQKKDLTGAYTRLIYLIPSGGSPLEVAKNYADEVKAQGGKLLFECAGDKCGGDRKRGSYGGGGNSSLSMYLYPREAFTDKYQTPGECVMRAELSDRYYLAAQLPRSGAHLSLYTYTLKADACDKVLGGRTVALVQIVEDKALENRMVVVGADEMAKSIADSGRIALYGIHFDSNKAELAAESDPTLEQIAKLLSQKPALKVLIVGHTDNVGGYASNLDLSQRRAKAVAGALSSRYKVDASRLTPLGVSFASPLGSNKTEDGRALNRRVEIVEQ